MPDTVLSPVTSHASQSAGRVTLLPKTVDHHVSSVLAKLGVSKRTEVAAAAKRAATPT